MVPVVNCISHFCNQPYSNRRWNGHAGMCGDVNLYLNDPDDAHSAEIEVGHLTEAGLLQYFASAA